MTSSLVGSEMCIRDRLKPSDGVRNLPAEPFPPIPHANACAQPAEKLLPCLLYTSDAADDM
eukprot:5513444-Prorocentrum_lima.AAC.1